MLYTLIFGASVRSQSSDLGTLKRILVNNGVANQFTVNPGLFGGPERVVPISDVDEASSEQIILRTSADEWKAYSAFDIDQHMVSDSAAAPSLMPLAPRLDITYEVHDVPTAEGTATDRSLTPMTVVLSNSTRVADRGGLAGIVIDMGIPQQLLLDGGDAVPFADVGLLDEEHIQLGASPARMDGATEPAALGDAPRRLDGTTPAGALGDRPPLVQGTTDTSRPTSHD